MDAGFYGSGYREISFSPYLLDDIFYEIRYIVLFS